MKRKFYKTYSNAITISFSLLIFIYFYLFSSIKIEACKLKILCTPEYYSEEQIREFEKNLNIKLPELAKKIYNNKVNIKDLIFINNEIKSDDVEIDCIFDLERISNECSDKYIEINTVKIEFWLNQFTKGSWKNLKPKSETAIPFAKNVIGDKFFIDENFIWYLRHEFERRPYKFYLSQTL